MMKIWENNGTEEIGLVTPTPELNVPRIMFATNLMNSFVKTRDPYFLIPPSLERTVKIILVENKDSVIYMSWLEITCWSNVTVSEPAGLKVHIVPL